MGFVSHVGHEWIILANLLCLLMGFALLSRHFEKSHVPVALSKYLPHDWKGSFVLLMMVWILSSFLDNIAGALIGGATAHQLFRAKVHVGYLAAIVAASNAGGAWSVLGDTDHDDDVDSWYLAGPGVQGDNTLRRWRCLFSASQRPFNKSTNARPSCEALTPIPM